MIKTTSAFNIFGTLDTKPSMIWRATPAASIGELSFILLFLLLVFQNCVFILFNYFVGGSEGPCSLSLLEIPLFGGPGAFSAFFDPPPEIDINN